MTALPQQKTKPTFGEAALISVVLVTASKFCTLPSVLAGIAGSKAIWAALILVVIEFAIVFFSLQTAKVGGLFALPIKRGIKVPILLLFLVFFTLKLTAISREISTYYALSLFENVAVLPIMILNLVTCALLAKKGGAALGRMTEIFVWVFVFVFLFVVIFTRTEGDFFNALGMFSPDLTGLGAGVFKGLAWFGDGAALCFFDLRHLTLPARQKQSKTHKAHRRLLWGAGIFCLLMVTLFFAVFTAVYGDAAKMTDYAFIKLSSFKANTDELGSADWPVIILWAILSSLYLALIFLCAIRCFWGLWNKKPKETHPFPYFLFGGAAILLSMLFLEEEGDYEDFMTSAMTVVTLLTAAITLPLGIFSRRYVKGGTREKQN